jgi:hypothetical protein
VKTRRGEEEEEGENETERGQGEREGRAGSSGLCIRAAVVGWVDRTFPFRRGGAPVTAFRPTGQVRLQPTTTSALPRTAPDFFFCLSVPRDPYARARRGGGCWGG